jgi:hypothetical protein
MLDGGVNPPGKHFRPEGSIYSPSRLDLHGDLPAARNAVPGARYLSLRQPPNKGCAPSDAEHQAAFSGERPSSSVDAFPGTATMAVGVSSEPAAEGTGAPRRDPVAVIADYLSQFVPDEPVAYDRPDPRTLVRWLYDEGWQITPTRDN